MPSPSHPSQFSARVISDPWLEAALRESPNGILKSDSSSFLELLLRGSHRVFPFLAKPLAINHPVNRVITEVRVNGRYHGMDLNRCKRAMCPQQVFKCPRKDGVGWTARKPQS